MRSVSPTPRVALVTVLLGVAALVLPMAVVLAAVVVVIALTAWDARAARSAPVVRRTVPSTVARGSTVTLTVASDVRRGRVALRQPAPPGLVVTPDGETRGGRLEAELTGVLRGRHVLDPVAVRTYGTLGLARRDHEVGDRSELCVVPDLPAAYRLARARREGRLERTEGRMTGALGLGTELESVREWSPDDDIRQVNWSATARLGRPMSNQYRVDQDRDLICLLDTGRLMSAPIGSLTRLDIALDALTAVAVMADDVGDRVGAVAFGTGVTRRVAPRRKGAKAVVQALFDLQPGEGDSDYDVAFRSVSTKRSLVMLFTDLMDRTAAESLSTAVPVLARRHAVVVATTLDDELESYVTRPPRRPSDVYAASLAVELRSEREKVVLQLRASGALVVQAAPSRLGAHCARAYLNLKKMARV